MVFQDRSLTCGECGNTFMFGADDQRYHMEKGYTDPKRCPSCRQQRRSQGGGGGGGGGGGYGGGGGGYGGGGTRQMYPVVCAECGNNTEVPFQPTGTRPVYCNDCFQKRRGPRY